MNEERFSDFLFIYSLRLSVVRNVSEAERAWFLSEAKGSEAESQAASASPGRETAVPSDRQEERNINNVAIFLQLIAPRDQGFA